MLQPTALRIIEIDAIDEIDTICVVKKVIQFWDLQRNNQCDLPISVKIEKFVYAF